MSRLSIVPQHVSVAAPIDLIFQIISMVDYDAMPGSVLSISRVATTGGRVLAEFTSHDEQTHVQIVKEVLADPPDRLTYRHLAGPYIGATEEIHLQPTENGT